MSYRNRLIVLLLLSAGWAACSSPDKEQYLTRGNALADAGKWAEALSEYQKAVEIDQADGNARARLADALEHTNPADVRRVRRERLRAAQALPGNIDLQFKAGLMLIDIRRWDDADLRADLILNSDPNSWQGRLLKGEIAAGRDDLARASALLEEAVTLAPQAAEPHVALGRLRQRQHRRDEAEALLLRAVQLAPQLPSASAALGEFYWAAGRAADAERALNQAIERDPADAASRRTLASLYQAEGRIAEAEAPLKAWAELRNDLPSRLALADYYIRANRLDDAQQTLSGAAVGESRTDLDLRLVEVAFRKNQKADAHRQVDAVLAKDATNVDWLEAKARLLMYEGKLDEALVRATQAVEADPESADAHFLLGTIQSGRRDIAAATEAFTRVMALTRQSQAAQNELVELQLQQGTPEALDQATATVGRSRTSPGPSLTLSRGLLQRGELRRAETLLTDLLREHDGVASVHVQIGRLRMLQNRPADARVEFDRALTINPRSFEAFRGRVEVELRSKNVPEARRLVEERLKTADSVPVLLLASRVYDAGGDARQSEIALRRVLEMNPDDETAMKSLVRLFEQQGRLEEMRVEYEAIAGKHADAIAASTMVGLILEAQDKPADAQRTFESVLARMPSAPVPLAGLARLHSVGAKNKLDQALELALRAKLLLPDSPEVAATLGWIYYRQGHAALAVSQLEASVAEVPNNPLFRYRLALAYTLAGNNSRALESLDQALRLKPDYPQALAAKADLRRGVAPTPQSPSRGGK